MNREKRFIRNVIYAFAAQGVSLFLSILTSLILPKFLDKTNWAYWSLFLFYTGYVGFFHFGLNDGVYLKAGGTEYEDMDKKLLGAQFRFGALFQTVIGIIMVVCTYFFVDEKFRYFAIIATVIYMLLFNLTMYLGCIFQAANETRLYSMSVMIDKIVFMIAVIGLFLLKSRDFRVYILLYLFAKICAFAYCVYKGREIVFARRIPMTETWKESINSIKIGINLTIANIASNLILGAGRFVIDKYWGIDDFGEFSFSLTLTNFFLLFISQISMVLFPALRQVDEGKLKDLFDKSKKGLLVVLPVIFLLYLPAKEILRIWLPQYEISLVYMAILLPMCIFDGKMNLVCATYFKVLRKEKFLLFVNLISMTLSVVLSIFGAFVLKNMDAVVLAMVIAVGVRYFISQFYLERMLENGKRHELIIQAAAEIGLTVICTFSCWRFNSLIAFGITLCAYVAYLLYNRQYTMYIVNVVKDKLKRR